MIFSSDHGDMQGAHGGLHEKWHVAYEEALRVPFMVSSPLLPGGARELEVPTSHADLIPTLLGLAGIDHNEALATLQNDHVDARPLVGRDLSEAIREVKPAARREPMLFTTDDEISEGSMPPASPFQRFARKLHVFSTVKQPNHLQTVIAEVDVGGAQHLVKFSRYYDNQQFWTVPGERDERLTDARRSPSPSPSPTNTSSTTSRSTRSKRATSPTPATPTTARARCSRRCSGSSTSSSPPNASHPQPASGRATNRQQAPDTRATAGAPGLSRTARPRRDGGRFITERNTLTEAAQKAPSG